VIVVRRPGLLTTVQDLGRPGLARIGVPAAGAVDVEALRHANLLVGNAPTAAALEVTVLGPELLFEVDATVAVAGRARFVPTGTVLDVGRVRDGVRGYVAVRGGLDVPPVLGSRSTCTLSGLGPPPLRAGDRLAVGHDVAGEPRDAAAPVRAHGPLRVLLGPREDALTGTGLRALLTQEWTVAPASDRTGLRLDGRPLERAGAAELPSEGVVTGAVQVPPDGRPVLFLANHPTTGGYPVVAVVCRADLGRAAQAAPGDRLSFAVPAGDRREVGQRVPGRPGAPPAG
jgi:biotin-dependent carboxylase-like uncharacterized protein